MVGYLCERMCIHGHGSELIGVGYGKPVRVPVPDLPPTFQKHHDLFLIVIVHWTIEHGEYVVVRRD